jgi:NADH-quinone oxidoreductase subunit M
MLSILLFNYILFFILIFFLLAVYFKFLFFTNTVNTIMYNSFYIVISTLLFFSILFNFYIYNIYISEISFLNFFLFTNKLFKLFYFPFIYVFIIITSISLIFCLTYNYTELISFLIYIILIFIAGLGLFCIDSLILFFIFYECLLFPSFIILYKYSKTRRSVEASYLMFFWTQFGALFLIFIFIYIFLITNSTQFSILYLYKFSKFELNFIFMFLLFGFGVKLPIWPFYDWLPKAHVEASTNFSIFLSGVLVKFAFFGFLKCLLILENEPTFFFVFPYLLVGMVDSIFKMYYQVDIKKLIAFATVAEMHWLLICIISGQSILWLAGFAMLISHAIISTNSFLLVDSIARRFKTRLVNEISGINFICPKLFLLALINCIIFLGFPGSLFFISEFLFFTFLLDLFPLYSFFLIILLYLVLAVFFLRLWMNVLFSSVNYSIKALVSDLDKNEFVIFFFLIVLIFWLGSSWQSLIF